MKGLPFRLPETQTASRRAPEGAESPDNMSHQRRPSASGGRFLSKKSPFARKNGRDCQKALPRGTTSRVFYAQKCPKCASVLTAKVCGKCVSHGKFFWQYPQTTRHDTQSQKF